ncbi:hypothetical protein VTJ49DRAFT_1637 [Mycothermus thermophilus]|uniref:Multicopper oxidase n=1 Tax=Humicola insolens TaxID=85995 RepID=A0ABR3VDY1_HUMIN
MAHHPDKSQHRPVQKIPDGSPGLWLQAQLFAITLLMRVILSLRIGSWRDDLRAWFEPLLAWSHSVIRHELHAPQFRHLLLFLVLWIGGASADTVTYDWNITWVWASPDGFAREVIGVNNQWPCPLIEATVGDTVVINLYNQLGNQTCGLHFHGIDQANTPWMDGPSGVTQCGVPPDTSLKYQFTVDHPGTYWYHSHAPGQYPDGLRGPIVFHDPNDPYSGQYDEDYILAVSDWYHSESLPLVQEMLQPENTDFLPPIPDNITNKTYRIRWINYAAFAAAMLHFDSHTMSVIMIDGQYVKRQDAYQLRLSPAQRYDFLLTGSTNDSGNYPYLMSLDLNRDWTNTTEEQRWDLNYTGYLVMDKSQPLSDQDVVDLWQPRDEVDFEPYDDEGILDPYDQMIMLNFTFCFDENDYPRACFNNLTYVGQLVPTLYSAATTGTDNSNPVVYGQVNPLIVNNSAIVQIVINNFDTSAHPFHLHGHHFQVVYRAPSEAGVWPGRDENYTSVPPRRDTVTVQPNSYVVLRFKANNPGVWLLHCHIEWHVEMGLTATIIEAPDVLRGMTFPDDHIAVCNKSGIPTEGNAAGNTENYTDTTGMQTVPDEEYTGAEYTTKKRRRQLHHQMGSFFFT